MTAADLYRRLFGYHRESDLLQPPLLHHTGTRIARDDGARAGYAYGRRLYTSVVLSELSDRAKRIGYSRSLVPDGAATEEERRWGVPEGTLFAMGAERSRRSIT